MYCDYWNLTKPPFDNVPDASMYVDCHESMENVISETIFAIKEGNECLTVIVGEVGLGKTLSLRVIIDSLEPDKYKVALITNPALSFIQLLREIIGQITGKQCLEKKKVDLLEIFNNLLFETADQGKKIVIVIDEANVLSPSNLDDLRLLTNMQDDERNLFTLLLVGQMEFAKTLEHPKRANLFQRIGTYGHLEKLPSREAVRDYIESRLKIAGTERKIFEDDAISVIWEFSEHGIPRLINKICKLCMKAGETNEFKTISSEVAEAIADRFQKLGKTSKPQRHPETEPQGKKTREAETKKLPKAPWAAAPKEETSDVKVHETPVPPRKEEGSPLEPRMVTPQPPPIPVEPVAPRREEAIPVQPRVIVPEPRPLRPIHPQMEDVRPPEPRMVTPQPPPAPVEPVAPRREEAIPLQPRVIVPEPRPSRPIHPQMEDVRPPEPRMVTPQPPPIPVEPVAPRREEAIPLQPRVVVPEPRPLRPIHPQMEDVRPPEPRMVTPQPPPTPVEPVAPRREEAIPVQPRAVPLAKPANYVPLQGVSSARNAVSVGSKQKEIEEQPVKADNEDYEDVLIGKQTVKLTIPSHIIKQAQLATPDNKNKLAGYWSAQILKENPSLTHSSLADPVSLWFDVKNVILKKFNIRSNTNVM